METNFYMILGFTVAFSMIFLHLGSFVIRSRNLTRDLEYLERSNKKTPKQTSARTKRKK